MKKLLLIVILISVLGLPNLLSASTANYSESPVKKEFRHVINGSGTLQAGPWGYYYTVGITYDPSIHYVLGVQVYYGSTILTLNGWGYSSATQSGSSILVSNLHIEFTDENNAPAYIDFRPGGVATFTVI